MKLSAFLCLIAGLALSGVASLFAGESCDCDKGILRIEIDDQDVLSRKGIVPLEGAVLQEAIGVIDAERKNWVRFDSATARLSIEAQLDEKTHTLDGNLTIRTVNAPKQRRDDLPWKWVYTFTAPDQSWSIQTDATGKETTITAKDEETRERLKEITDNGQLFGLLSLPQQLVLILYSDATYPAAENAKIVMLGVFLPRARATGVVEKKMQPKLVSFALMNNNPKGKSILFRNGHLHQFITPPDNEDGDAERTFTFDNVQTSAEGFSYPTRYTLVFPAKKFWYRLTLESFAPVLKPSKQEDDHE